ncbi:Peptidase M23 [Desulfosarcina cetonica]|uniref:M23 family metallopeptidase n=1 Tax=Desulfosarcina cetonica TaxID=90730 RepID=UPI0006D26055|nr:M23 family metallopeptidase [Desulfosarcina cetonica]VTR68274.1 Peptidase M23 [Desulfosarcina cetonica]
MQGLRIHALIAIVVLGLPFSARAFTLSGNLVQGGMAIGHVAPGSRVSYEGRPIRVSPDGLFVIGFSRDAKAQAMLTVQAPQGGIAKHPISIKPRQYDIQRIDGLPPKKVTPTAKADLARIRADIALVRKVRRRDDPRTDFDQPFIWPVLGRISGVYGSQRILNGNPRRPHFGVDIAVPTGTPVKAPADGVVSMAHDDMFYSGGTLIVDHGHGISTVYMHLSKILVAEGTQVRQGDVIAQVGATGRVTGPHLHWGMNWFETRLDPSLLVSPMPETAATP